MAHTGAKRFMHHLGAFPLRAMEAEETKDIVWGSCLPTTGPRRNNEHTRVELVGHPRKPRRAFEDARNSKIYAHHYLMAARPCAIVAETWAPVTLWYGSLKPRARSSSSTNLVNLHGIRLLEHRSGNSGGVIRAGARRTPVFPWEKIVKIHSIALIQHQRVSKRVLFEDGVVPEVYMPAHEPRHELVPIPARIPYRSIPRHTP